MSARAFLDTNIVVYSFDATAPAKQARARRLLASPECFVSWQVIQEFSSVALHKFAVPLRGEDLRDFIALRLWPLCRVLPSEAIFLKTVEIQHAFGYRYDDSLIIAAALAGGASRLLSEDLQHGQCIGDLVIENPFRR